MMAWRAIGLSLLAGVLACVGTYGLALGTAGDFIWLHAGAAFVFAGVDPYQGGLHFGAGYLDTAPLFYPLPAVLLSSPFVLYPARLATALMVGLAAAVLVLVAWPRNRLVLLVLVSAPMLLLLRGGQVTLWLLIAAVAAPLWWLVVLKPSLGLVVVFRWFFQRTWTLQQVLPGLVLLVLLTAVAFVFQPDWVSGWMTNLHAGSVLAADRPDYYGPVSRYNAAEWTEHVSPLMMTAPGGILLALLSGLVLARRKRQAWLIVGLALIPQMAVLYDTVLLWLVPRQLRSALILTIGSWILFLAAQFLQAWTTDVMPLLHQGMYIVALGALLSEEHVDA